MKHGMCGRLQSCSPPITVPAWSSMMSSKDPGTLGIYGFPQPLGPFLRELTFATGAAVRERPALRLLSDVGKRVILLGVPQTYPPQPLNGLVVGCFLTPSIDNHYTYPDELKHEIARVVGPYMVDVPDFRTEDKARLRRHVHHDERSALNWPAT